ncbi:MAG: tetratricopeptide repeat protein [Bacteroides sp.]|nr:tetratricopeptide repeat protein [Bacteroides sp.]
MRKLIILPAAMLTALSGMSQINSPKPDGSLLRGELMLRDKTYYGTIDQISNVAPGSFSGSEQERAAIALAAAQLFAGNLQDARSLFEDFVVDYPISPACITARMGIADCDFYDGNYRRALNEYRAIDRAALNLSAGEDYTYRTSFCHLMLGDMDEAESGFDSLAGTARYRSAALFYKGYIEYANGAYAKAKTLFSDVDQSCPPGDMAPYYLAQIAYIDGDYQHALSMARQHMGDIKAFEPELRRIAGESLYNLGDESQAIEYLTKYVSETSDPQLSALYILGVSHYKEGQYAKAIETLDKVTGSDDAMGQSAYLYIGQSYLKEGNANAAILALEKAYRMDYDKGVSETAFYNYAVARSQGGRTPFGSSVDMFEYFLKEYPNSHYADEVQEYLVTGYMTDNNYEKALASIQKIRRPSQSILNAKQRVLYTLGTRDLASGNASLALERFKEARAISGADRSIAAECNLWMGDCYYRLGKYADASKAYNDYLKAAGSTSPNKALAYYDLGYSRFAEKKYDAARKDFERVIASPGDLGTVMIADAYNRVGDCYYYGMQFGKAEQNYEQSYSLNPSTGDYAIYQKAMMKGLTRDYNGKIKLLDEMTESYPSSGLLPSALLEKAESYVALGRTGDAVSLYRELVKKYPTTSQGRNAYIQLAVTLQSQGKTGEAIDTYKKVISSYPTSEEARVASDDLKRILADAGRLNEYTSFIASVPNAPKFEISELDGLTFQAAEKAYLLDNSSVSRLKDYLDQYPGGRHEAQALNYLCEASMASGNEAEALKYAAMIVEKYPDSDAAEDALAVKGAVEYNSGDGEQALATFRQLEKRASVSRNIVAARLGIMRVSRDLGKYSDVVKAADGLLASESLPSSSRSEVVYSRALALANTGHGADAAKEWEGLAKNTDDLYGAKSAYYLGQYYLDGGQVKKARSVAEKLIDSNTPHSYWLARGYILLSDICKKQGDDFEAREYLKSLKENYPGTESDIFMMIDERLK